MCSRMPILSGLSDLGVVRAGQSVGRAVLPNSSSKPLLGLQVEHYAPPLRRGARDPPKIRWVAQNSVGVDVALEILLARQVCMIVSQMLVWQ